MSGEFARIDGDVFRLKSTMDQLLASFETLQDAMAGGASKTDSVEALLQQFIDNFADRQPPPRISGDTRERHAQKSQFTGDTAPWKKMAGKSHVPDVTYSIHLINGCIFLHSCQFLSPSDTGFIVSAHRLTNITLLTLIATL